MLTSFDQQIVLSKAVGKLPGRVDTWKHMKQTEPNAGTRAILNVFDDAMCYTEDRGWPNLPNLVELEEELKTGIEGIWRKSLPLHKRQGRRVWSRWRSAAKESSDELKLIRQHIECYLSGEVSTAEG